MLHTFEGIVQQGRIRLSPGARLPDGAKVYVTWVPGVDERRARRKANRWLGENIGDKIMAAEGTLTRLGDRQVWRFGVFVTFTARDPFGPIGYVYVDADVGDVLLDDAAIEEMIQRGENLERAPLSPVG
jgi:hypothetical protein